jgi:type I restriction enzyme M protein
MKKPDESRSCTSTPAQSELIDSAIEISRILRLAKIETLLRPRVIGALTLAMYQGEIDTCEENSLDSINSLIQDALEQTAALSQIKKTRLFDSLKLAGADYDRLNDHISSIVQILSGLNIRSVLQTDNDFLTLFYDAFLRYGYDNNALGIVFTPRHITKLCVDLVGVRPDDRVIDIACGTGGFLISAFEKMKASPKPIVIDEVTDNFYGFDTNPTIWALATLNMIFLGAGKSHIENQNCFDMAARNYVEQSFSRAFLNPPYSQEGEPVVVSRSFRYRSFHSGESAGFIEYFSSTSARNKSEGEQEVPIK